MSAALLVTGGAGFIGSNFVLSMRAAGYRIVNLDKLTYAGNLGNLTSLKDDPDHVFVQGDIGDRGLVAFLLAEHQPSAVVHFAAETHVDRSITGPKAFIETNVVGTFELLEACRRHLEQLPEKQAADFRFVHVSTDEVYGALGRGGYFRETSPYAPSSPYAASKAASDHIVRAYHRTYGLPAIVTHCSNNYGRMQFPEKLIPVVIHRALEDKPIPVYGDGSNVRDWLHVSDHCRALRAVLERGAAGETYDSGGGCERSNIQLVREICAVLDERKPRKQGRYADQIVFVTDRLGHDYLYAIDSAKIRGELGWQPLTTFWDGIRSTVGWYLEHEPWCESIRARQAGGP